MQVHKPFKWLQPHLADFVTHHGTQPVCDFVGASRSSVERWTANSNPAQGQFEIRLWHFVLAAGYQVPELRVPPFNEYLAELYAYSVITIEEAMQLSGVKNSQDVLQIMRGREPMQSVTVDELEEMYGQALKAKKQELQQQLLPFVQVAQPVHPQLSLASDEFEAPTLAHDVLVPVLANMLLALAPLANLALTQWTPEQRSRLRELVGLSFVFSLSNDMNALCSERALANQGRR